MKRKLPLLLITVFLILSSFSDKQSTKVWFKSDDGQGFISIEKIKKTGADSQAIIKTTVKANFDNEKLDFSLSTFCDTDKMVNASKIMFDGTIDSNMDPVKFVGTRIKQKKNAAFWDFQGDFKNELGPDEEANHFISSKHSSTIRIPARTIPSFNVWAIVSELPFDKKGTFKFNLLDETKLYVKRNQTINYLGKHDEDVNGEKTLLHKFVHQGDKVKPAYYWVNDDRELIKILLDGKFTFTKSSKSEI